MTEGFIQSGSSPLPSACVECRHYRYWFGFGAVCDHPEIAIERPPTFDLVTGWKGQEPAIVECRVARSGDGLCGIQASLFQERQVMLPTRKKGWWKW